MVVCEAHQNQAQTAVVSPIVVWDGAATEMQKSIRHGPLSNKLRVGSLLNDAFDGLPTNGATSWI